MNSQNSQMYSKPDAQFTPEHRTAQVRLMPPTAALELEQENARLRLALRELRHRSCNQWQLLIGLAEMESMQHPQSTALGCSVRLSTMAYAFVTLNRALDANLDVLAGNQKVGVRAALESILMLLQAAIEEDSLSFMVQDAWLPEKGCAALMLICAELVCNATKHGRKTTQVTFRTLADQGILEVRDDGPGFPTGFRFQERGGAGTATGGSLMSFRSQRSSTLSERGAGRRRHRDLSGVVCARSSGSR